jgi:hypothetical protein
MRDHSRGLNGSTYSMKTMRAMRLWLCALAFIAFFIGMGSARAAQPVVIYGDALHADWQDWSWSSGQNLYSNAAVQSGSYAVSLNQAGYGGFYLHAAAFDSSGHAALTFWAHGGATGGQQLQVHARDASGNPLPSVAIAPLQANQWKQYTLSLASLGVTGAQQITGFVIQNATAATLPLYHLDNIVLTATSAGRHVVYDEQMTNGWQAGGWRTTRNLANTSPVHGGAKSIAVTPTGEWAAITFEKSGFNTAGYDKITFWVHGGTAGGQLLSVDAYRNGEWLGDLLLPPLVAGQWNEVSVPLSAINAANTTIDLFDIKHYSAASGPTFYVDDVALVADSGAPMVMTGLRVSGNKLLNGEGKAVFLHGVDRSATEYECVQGGDNTPRNQAFVTAVKSWNANVVRVPLNEHCWLGINATTANAPYMGAVYRQKIVDYVNLMTSSPNNLAVILDLHWAAPGTTPADRQQPMPNADHSPAFWTSVATTFAGNSAVIFDLYNEPYAQNGVSATQAWQCWLNGGSSCTVTIEPGTTPYVAAGMQSLVNAVRATGASNVLMVGGLAWANDLSQWLAYKPTDPKNNIVASWHAYSFNACSNLACWNAQIAPVIAQHPLVAGEFGTSREANGTCNMNYMGSLLSFLESKKQGYLAWTFNDWPGNCSDSAFNHGLTIDAAGTPSSYGRFYYDHLRGLPGAYPP